MMAQWRHTLHGWGTILLSDDDFSVKRAKLVALLRESQWFKDQDDGDDSELGSAIFDLENAPTAEDGEQAMFSIYNLADADRVWLPFTDETLRKETS